jgi:hypothetical protein
LIRNVPRASRSSQSQGLQRNGDGSVDIYFGPKARTGKESNWIPTSAGGQFEVLFRAYGPEKAFFDKTWLRRGSPRIYRPNYAEVCCNSIERSC